MKIQYVFYIVGVIFIFISAIYFAAVYLKELSNSIKLLLLIFSVIISFIVAEILRGVNK